MQVHVSILNSIDDDSYHSDMSIDELDFETEKMAHIVDARSGSPDVDTTPSPVMGSSVPGGTSAAGSIFNMSADELQKALKSESMVVDTIMPDTLPADVFLIQSKSFVNPSEEDFDAIEKQFRTRLEDGQGEFVFELGIGENEEQGLTEEELKLSSANLIKVCERVNTRPVLLREKSCNQSHAAALMAADYLIRRVIDETDFIEVRVAVVGNVDAGKSTLLGVLTNGTLDDGRGNARLKLFRHKHEADTGRTSSVGNDILGFDHEGNVVNKTDGHGSLDWTQVCKMSTKVITFIDLAGHEKYLKTTIFGMTGHLPDFCMLMVGANAGVIGMTKEHLGLALALNVPVFVVVTKIDMCPDNVLKETLKLLQRILKSPGCRKIPIFVQNRNDVIITASNFTSERVCPIFQVSNVTGVNLDLLTMFLNLLTARSLPKADEPAEFQIDDIYSVPGVGTVVAGTTLRGVINLNDNMLLGPDGLGEFQTVPVKSIHRKRLPVKFVRGGQTASFSLKKIKRNQIRKGMVLVSPALKPFACWEFEGEILVLHHPTTISVKYQAMVHCCSVRQTAAIIHMDTDSLRTGDKATIRFRFIKNPEYIRTGIRLVFREGRTKAVGSITKVFHPSTTPGASTHRTRYAPKFTPLSQGGENGGGENGQRVRYGRRRGGGRHKKVMAANFDNAPKLPMTGTTSTPTQGSAPSIQTSGSSIQAPAPSIQAPAPSIQAPAPSIQTLTPSIQSNGCGGGSSSTGNGGPSNS